MNTLGKKFQFALLIVAVALCMLSSDKAYAIVVDSMRMPFSSSEQWKVVNGYGGGACHLKPSPCRGDQYYSLDLVPTSGDAGGRYVYAPVTGTISSVFNMGTGKGWGIKIRTSDGYTVHLYHLMNTKVATGNTVSKGAVVAQVYNAYAGLNHLHIQVTTSSGASLPMRLSGKYYYNKGGTNQWKDQVLQNNITYKDANYSGSTINWITGTSSLVGYSANDVVSSVRVNPGCRITLYEHINYGGASITFSSNVSNLANYGFNDKASSLKVTCP